MQSDIATAWDRHAADYAKHFAPLTGFIAQAMFRMVQARLRADARIVDIACGTGELTMAALRHLRAQAASSIRTGAILATDIAPAMVERTRLAVAGEDESGMVRCEVRDGQALGLPDASFDAALSSFGIFLFPDRLAGWREAARVLKPGGLFAAAVWRGPDENPLFRLQMEPLMAALPKRLTDPSPRPDWAGILSAEGLAAEVTAAAPFEAPSVSVFHATLAMPRPAAMWTAMKGNPVLTPLLAGCDAGERASVERAMLAHFEAMAGGPDRPLLFPASCHILIAHRA